MDGPTWHTASQAFLRAKSRQAGAPPPLSLLSTAPAFSNPSWRTAPSFAASTLLAELCDAGSGTSSCGGGAGGTLLSKALWASGARNIFFVVATPLPFLEATRHRAKELLPLVVEYALADYRAHQAHSGSSGSNGRAGGGAASDEGAMAEQAARLYLGMAADMQSWAMRSLGWVLTHAFR